MTKIGGWWMSSMALEDDEDLLHKYPTNYFGEDSRPYGGRLYVTDQRFIFLPHRLDSILGAGPVHIPFDTVNDVSSEADELSEAELESRRIPERLRIETLAGESHHFFVEDLEDTLASVHEVLGIANPAGDGDEDTA